MLREELRATLMEKIKTNPKEAIKILEEDPKILEILLNNSKEAESEKNEKIKYINMSQQMQNQLEEQAKN